MGCGPSQLKRHENDLKMVEQLLAKDGATLDAGTTALLIWKCRRDPRLVAAAAAWLEKHSDARRAFDGVEFYLPQLSHMLVHLDVDWPAGTLERFALVVAQQSPHFALQLHWILRAALEDYAPRGDGSGGHERYYRRCAHLAADVESCVAHGSARPENLEELFVAGLIGRDELGARGAAKQASLAQRLVDAALRPMLSVRDGGEPELVDPDVVPHRASTFSGPLSCYVDGSGGACARGGAWAATVAKVESRSLLVYDAKKRGGRDHGRLLRAMPLDGSSVNPVEDPGGDAPGFDFVVAPRRGDPFAAIRLRALSAETRERWLACLGEEARRAPAAPPAAPGGSPARDRGDAASRRRYDFFLREKKFVDALVGVAEDLRALPRAARQSALPNKLAAVDVNPLAYVPLCNSTDTWRSVLRIVPDEGSVFNTKERCPCLVYFETAQEPGLEGLDVANVVHAHVAGPDAALPAGAAAPPRRRNKCRRRPRSGAAGSFDSEQSALTPQGASAEPPRFGIRRGSRGRSSPPGDGSPTKPRPSLADRAAPPCPSGARSAEGPRRRPRRRRRRCTPRRRPSSSRRAATTSRRPAGPPRDEKPAPARRASARASRVQARASRVLDFWGEQFRRSQLHYSPRRSRPQEHDRPSDASAGRWSFGEGPSMWARPSEARHPELSHGAGWKAKEQAARDKSPFAANAPSWRLQAVIVKSNDDLRQEVFVVQLIAHYARAFRSAKLGLFLRPYRIVAVSSTTGLIELVKESTSLDRLYASSGGGLKAHFESTFGPPGSPELAAAVGRFAESLAAASFVCYVLAIKDRHNGNILLDAQGRIVHIDFGFVLGHATGGAFSMERAPFKLTGDFLDVLGDDGLERFASALGDAFVAAAASVDEVTALVEIMQYKSTFPCFRARGAAAVSDFKKRHHAHLGEADLRKKARALVAASANHVGTYVYDVFQHKTNGVSYTK
ncbi:phosphatidylinositol kinase [Aureococcus anophagefferens]|nr:phosphatidylinositol kinase [Aureococcus anophagefferens]